MVMVAMVELGTVEMAMVVMATMELAMVASVMMLQVVFGTTVTALGILGSADQLDASDTCQASLATSVEVNALLGGAAMGLVAPSEMAEETPIHCRFT